MEQNDKQQEEQQEKNEWLVKIENWIDSKATVIDWVLIILAVYNLYKQFVGNYYDSAYWVFVIFFGGIGAIHRFANVAYSKLSKWILLAIAAVIALLAVNKAMNSSNGGGSFGAANKEAAKREIANTSTPDLLKIISNESTGKHPDALYSADLMNAAKEEAKRRGLFD